MKNLKELKGVKEISKTEQKVITGGGPRCDEYGRCLYGGECRNNYCYAVH